MPAIATLGSPAIEEHGLDQRMSVEERIEIIDLDRVQLDRSVQASVAMTGTQHIPHCNTSFHYRCNAHVIGGLKFVPVSAGIIFQNALRG